MRPWLSFDVSCRVPVGEASAIVVPPDIAEVILFAIDYKADGVQYIVRVASLGFTGPDTSLLKAFLRTLVAFTSHFNFLLVPARNSNTCFRVIVRPHCIDAMTFGESR